jgi:DNA-binding beta-propeller fold protein YncE
MLRFLLAALVLSLAAQAARAADAPTYALAGRIAGPDGSWDYASFDPALRRAYFSRSDGVTVLEVDTLNLIGHLTDAQSSHKIVPLRRGAEIAITNRGTNGVLFVDAKTGKLIASVASAKGPDGAIIDPATGLLLVMTHSGQLGLVDPVRRTSAGAIDLAGGQEEAVAVDGKVYIALEDKNALAVVDVRARKVLKVMPIQGCEGPGGLTYASRIKLIVAACGENQVATFIRPADGSVVASVPIGKGPDGALYDEARGVVLIPCGRDGVLDVISASDPAHIALAQAAKTAVGARTATLDPKTGRVYLPTAQYDIAHFGPGRFPTVPGTFAILVVAPSR